MSQPLVVGIAARGLRLILWTALVAFMVTPMVAVFGASLTPASFWQFPPSGISANWYAHLLTSGEYARSLVVSVQTAVIVMLVSIVVGVGAALAIQRGLGAGAPVVQSASLAPLMLPEITLGVAIYGVFVAFGLPITFTTLAFAQLVVVLPFTLRLLIVGLSGMDPNVERAALDLGASPIRVLTRVTLPIMSTTLIAAAFLALLRSFDDVGIALFVSGPGTVTLPVRLLLSAETERGPVIAAGASVLLVVGVVAVAIVSRTVGLARLMGLRER